MIFDKFSFSFNARTKWFVFLFICLLQLCALFYISWRWHNIQVDGIPYQWQCIPRLEQSAFGTDYIRVVFPEDTTKWLDNTKPERDQIVYVYISRNESGIMQIEGASAEKPPVGKDYMKASVVDVMDGTIQFRVNFDRYRIDPEKADGIYDIAASDSVIASVRMKKGEGVIEGIFINGMPLELCGSAAEQAAANAQKTQVDNTSTKKKLRIGEPGMVPPKKGAVTD